VCPAEDKENHVKKEIGLWIDHREAILVIFTGDGEEIRHITSDMGKRVRYSGGSRSKSPEASKNTTAEDQRDRKFGNQLNQYYDEVITALREAISIQIFGPGEAKGELEKRIEHAGLKPRVLTVETTDKMTERQIAAKVRSRLPT
jgi:hypothetical protein